jgi:hypothetical protein
MKKEETSKILNLLLSHDKSNWQLAVRLMKTLEITVMDVMSSFIDWFDKNWNPREPKVFHMIVGTRVERCSVFCELNINYTYYYFSEFYNRFVDSMCNDFDVKTLNQIITYRNPIHNGYGTTPYEKFLNGIFWDVRYRLISLLSKTSKK